MITIVLAGCPFSLGIKIFIIDFFVIEGYIYKTVRAFKKKKKNGKRSWPFLLKRSKKKHTAIMDFVCSLQQATCVDASKMKECFLLRHSYFPL